MAWAWPGLAGWAGDLSDRGCVWFEDSGGWDTAIHVYRYLYCLFGLMDETNYFCVWLDG